MPVFFLFGTFDTFFKFYNKLFHFILFQVVRIISTSFLIIMSSPGQKRGSCGHVMALFDNHKKCTCCREKGVGNDPVSRNKIARYVRRLCLLRFYNWPPRLTKQEKNIESRRNLKQAVTRPPLSWTLQM